MQNITEKGKTEKIERQKEKKSRRKTEINDVKKVKKYFVIPDRLDVVIYSPQWKLMFQYKVHYDDRHGA